MVFGFELVRCLAGLGAGKRIGRGLNCFEDRFACMTLAVETRAAAERTSGLPPGFPESRGTPFDC